MIYLINMLITGIYEQFLLHICGFILRMSNWIYSALPIYGKFGSKAFHYKYNET